jgi:hypothetical protein|tara:strand:- start:101 stop:391 length:291 start_codon:yes stop_codon:yes gene_type:complete
MRFLVGCQVRTLRKAFVAAWISAHVWLLTCVGPKMSAQVKVQRKSFEAEFAFERLFSCVDQLMPLELGVVEEALAAAFDGTDVLALTMSHEMLAQR